MQFTIGPETHDKLRRVQALLRREIPDGDPGAIFDRALALLLEKVERTKLGATAKPRRQPPIRPGTDTEIRRRAIPSRDIPRAVKHTFAWSLRAEQNDSRAGRPRKPCPSTGDELALVTNSIAIDLERAMPRGAESRKRLEELSARAAPSPRVRAWSFKKRARPN